MVYPLVSVIAADGEVHQAERELVNPFLVSEGLTPLADDEFRVHTPQEVAHGLRHGDGIRSAALLARLAELPGLGGVLGAGLRGPLNHLHGGLDGQYQTLRIHREESREPDADGERREQNRGGRPSPDGAPGVVETLRELTALGRQLRGRRRAARGPGCGRAGAGARRRAPHEGEAHDQHGPQCSLDPLNPSHGVLPHARSEMAIHADHPGTTGASTEPGGSIKGSVNLAGSGERVPQWDWGKPRQVLGAPADVGG